MSLVQFLLHQTLIFKNGLKMIQAVAYNVACMVSVSFCMFLTYILWGPACLQGPAPLLGRSEQQTYSLISLTKDKISSDDTSNINNIYHINLIDQKKISIWTFDPELKEQCIKMVEEKEGGLNSWLQNIVKLTRDYLNSNSDMKVMLTNLDLRKFVLQTFLHSRSMII